jgi:hypothetical protein
MVCANISGYRGTADTLPWPLPCGATEAQDLQESPTPDQSCDMRRAVF